MPSQRSIMTCPYYQYEAEGCIHCEGGKIDMKRDKKMLNDYINGYCATFGYKRCTMAQSLTRHYERAEERGV